MMRRPWSAEKTWIYSWWFLAGVLIMAMPAFAKSPCAEDADKLCYGMKWGKGLEKCLRVNKSELSVSCRNRISSGNIKKPKKGAATPTS